MEARCGQFATDAARPSDKNTPKDVEKLRRFLHRNQQHRFTDREQTHLFQAVQRYVQQADAGLALPLLEDALKMPFTVFTSGHKAKMLRWLERLNSAGDGGHLATMMGSSSSAASTRYAVLDLDADAVEVMDEADGETTRISLAAADPDLVRTLQDAFQSGGGVHVVLTQCADAQGRGEVGLTLTGVELD